MEASDFGERFFWGASTSAYQIEGACNEDGKDPNIWDDFTKKKSKIKNGENANHAADFYHNYEEDLLNLKEMGFKHFRFSISWSRILPQGIGEINEKGLAFYQRVINKCLELEIEPWITLYHWDLPSALQEKGGWANRKIIDWFDEFAHLCLACFGDRVKYWMLLNEPIVFTGAGYLLGLHAPGLKSIPAFLKAAHHANLCMALSLKSLKSKYPKHKFGTTVSLTQIDPINQLPWNVYAAKRIDKILNYLFLYPMMGKGYPVLSFKRFSLLKKYMKAGDLEHMVCNFDFIGAQIYTRQKVKFGLFSPFLNARLVEAPIRGVRHNALGWEVKPQVIYNWIKKLHQLGIKNIMITENGYADNLEPNAAELPIEDDERIRYHNLHLRQVLRAKKDGFPVKGYFVWSLIDNFEWAEGYSARFGIVAVDFKNFRRTIKKSGFWWRDFLLGTA